MMIKKIVVLVVVALVGLGGTVFAQAPQVLNFQGRLHDSAGNPVADGDYTIEFRMYTTETGGIPVWNQTQTVTVADGVFNVLLDNVDIDLSTSTYYLTLKVGSDSEMTPRQRITGVFYTLNAEMSDGDGHSLDAADGTPVDVVYVDNDGNVEVRGGFLTWPGRLHFRGGNDLYIQNQTGGVTIGRELGGSGDLTVQGDVDVHGFLTSPGRLHIRGGNDLYFQSKIGGVTIGKELGGSGDLTVQGNVEVRGGFLTWPGRLHVRGGNDLYIQNQIGGVTIGRELGGTGNLTVQGDVDVHGFFTSPGRLHVRTGNDLYIQSEIGGVTIGKELGGTGNLTVQGKVDIGGPRPAGEDLYQLFVTGPLKVYNGADFAEPFNMTDMENLEMGDVVVIDPNNPEHVKQSATAYDTAVAGIVSSIEQSAYIAGERSDGTSDKPIALAGRVLCKVSTENGPIQVGDLLTSSNTPGHAMKATEKDRMIGALLGKALQAFDGETGKIMVLVALQ